MQRNSRWEYPGSPSNYNELVDSRIIRGHIVD